MSDFIYTSDLSSLEILASALRAIPDTTNERLHRFEGSWGALVVSDGPYKGFQPLETEKHIVAIAGGPVLRFRDNTFLLNEESSIATDAVYRRWLAGEVNWGDDLSGPYAVLVVDKEAGSICVVTDLMSFIPVYRHQSELHTVIGTHVDVVAKIAGEKANPDKISAVDFILHGFVTYPYTLYRNVAQIAPASVHMHDQSSRTTVEERAYWTLPHANRDSGIRLAAKKLRDSLREYVGRVTEGMDGVASFVSGGEDSRVVLGLLSNLKGKDAYIFLNGMNREGEVARRASELFGARFHMIQRDPRRYLKLFPECSNLVGSGSQYAHAHTYGYHRSESLNRYAAVFGGFASDRLLKGEHAVRVSGSGRMLFLPEIANKKSYKPNNIAKIFPDDISAAVRQRWQEHWHLVSTFRGEESADEWFNVWPSSMAVGAPNIHANRRLFCSYEPFLDCQVVKLASEIPQSWKLNRRVFRLMATPLLWPARWLLHVKGWNPVLPFWLNSPLRLYFRVMKSLKRRLGSGVVHEGPWFDRRAMVRDRLWFALDAAVRKQSDLQQLLGVDGCFDVWFDALSWKQKLNLFQVAHNLGYINGEQVIANENSD